MTVRFQGTCQERGHIPAFPRHPNIKFVLQATPNHGQPCSIAGVFSEDPKKLNLIVGGRRSGRHALQSMDHCRFQWCCQSSRVEQKHQHVPAFPGSPNIKFELQASPNQSQPCPTAAALSRCRRIERERLELAAKRWGRSL